MAWWVMSTEDLASLRAVTQAWLLERAARLDEARRRSRLTAAVLDCRGEFAAMLGTGGAAEVEIAEALAIFDAEAAALALGLEARGAAKRRLLWIAAGLVLIAALAF